MENVKFDFSRLRGRIVERFGSCSAFGKELGWTRGAVSTRLNNKVPWKDVDIYDAAKLLDIPDSEIVPYFFTPKFD